MTSGIVVRDATANDLERLLELYVHLTPNNRPIGLDKAEQIFGAFLRYEGSAILLGESEGVLVSSCTLAVIPNLTRIGRPYALVENVVTHEAYRRRGYGKAMLDAASEKAWAQDCYKVMLMTGNSDEATLKFYEHAGFEQSKTGFQKRRAAEARK